MNSLSSIPFYNKYIKELYITKKINKLMENMKKVLTSDERVYEAYPGFARKIPVNTITKYAKSICKLTIEDNSQSGYGFFMCLYIKEKETNCLLTNYHVITQDLVDKKIYISI
jgi:hypothetical protein